MAQRTQFTDVESIFEGRLRGNQAMLSGLGLTVDEARLLWQAPRMKEVSWLDLDDNQLGDGGLAELAACVHLENVQYLNLNKNGVTDAGLQQLAQSKCLPKLKRLHLKGNPIAGPGVIALFESQTLDGLTTFQVNEGWTCKKREGWRYNPQL
ncbi:MAG: protein phosphatase 1 regulatory subunit 42 [Gammaproteobacteria bacterium]|nr:protein phosphatase 1 regulatory subunit 42 [Gammaproteobacteria bacterium]